MSVRRRPDTGKWEARWRENGRNRSRSFARKADADSWAIEIDRSKRLGTLRMLTAPDRTLAELVVEYWENYAVPRLARQTRTSYLAVWERYARIPLGGYKLRDLTTGRLDSFRADLEREGVGAPTVIKTLTMLQSTLGYAARQDYIVGNPMRDVSKPRQSRRRDVVAIPPTTVEAIRAAIPFRSATLVSMLAYAGLRPGEALALRWLDVGERRVHVQRAIALGSEKTTKTGRTRSVHLLAPLAGDLEAYRREYPSRDGALVFARANGEPWTDHTWRNWRRRIYQPAARAAGLEAPRPYDLRHAFVSLLIAEGRNVVEVARQAGHSPTTCLSTYAHVFEESDPAARTTAEDAIRAARAQADVRVTYAEAP